MHDRFRTRFISAMGLSTIALAGEGCASNTPSNSPAPTATSPAATSTAAPVAIDVDALDASPAPTVTPSVDASAPPDAGSVSTPRPRPASHTVADAGPPKTSWTATYRRPEQPYEYCRTGYAECSLGRETPSTHPTSTVLKDCPSAIDVPCECSPHAGCFQPSTCTAPLLAPLSRDQRARHPGACCYAPPRRCPHPGEGRPLRIEGERRVADTMRRQDWSNVRLDLLPIAEEGRAATVQRWLERAAGEHASIGSFARVALDLLELGAPADLIARTHAAAIDEVHHARFAFAVASAYAGAPFGPGPLAAKERRDVTFPSFTRDTFLDACVEETIGALILREEAEQCEDRVLRERLGTIADEEAAHAELGWATLAWAVRHGETGARRALEDALGSLAADCPITRDVILPCARALIASLDRT